MKWSQVPWATVLTGAIALYGAGLSTYLALRQRRPKSRN